LSTGPRRSKMGKVTELKNIVELSDSTKLDNYIKSHMKEIIKMKSWQFLNKMKKLFPTLDIKDIMLKYPRLAESELIYLPETISSNTLIRLEKALDKLFNKIGIDIEFTKHFMDRVNDARNGKPIEVDELISIFQDTYKKVGPRISKLPQGSEAVLKDVETDINIPFVLEFDPNSGMLDLISKTVMRKKNFLTRTKVYHV